MVVELNLNGHKTEAIFDTGCAPDGVVLPKFRMKEFGIQTGSQGYYADSVEIGPISQRYSKVYVIEGSDVILIGPHFFKGRRFTVDPVNKLIKFQF
jgi:hypothetical protein